MLNLADLFASAELSGPFCQSQNLCSTARQCIYEKLRKLDHADQKQGRTGATQWDQGSQSADADDAGFLAYLLSQRHVLSENEAIANVTDLMMAAVDTVW